MSYQNQVKLLGDQEEDSEWIPQAKKKWVPHIKQFKKWGTNLNKPRKQWQGSSNNRKGGNK